jgi:hypothetical protein
MADMKGASHCGKTLVLRPIGGLCNRLRAVGSALELAAWQQRQLTVLWHVNDELGARFDELFEPLPGVTVIPITERALRDWPRKWAHAYALLPRGPLVRMLTALHRRARFDRVFLPEECRRRAAERTGYKDVRDLRRLLFVYYDWLVNGQVHFDSLRPRGEIAERIDQIAARFGPRTIGVHIRRTDSEEAIRRSPLALFVRHMEQLAEEDRATTFFLATDDPAVEVSLVKHFGNRIIPANRTYGRSELAGIQAGVVDLFCLSRTTRVLGSYISSFSETAARLGHIDLTVLDNGRNRAQ